MADTSVPALGAASAPSGAQGKEPQAQRLAKNGVTANVETGQGAQEEVMKKYERERAKRLRSDGVAQYISPSKNESFKHFQEDPWSDSNTPNPGLDRLTKGHRFQVVIIGAGYGGLLFAARLQAAGIQDFAIVDVAGGFGGTWYWNRYPGLMCDVESYIYMPLLEETGYMPKYKYSSGHELREYAEMLADKFQLRKKAAFRVKVNCMTWDDAGAEWILKLGLVNNRVKGDLEVRSQAVISTTGILNLPKMPGVEGIQDFTGHSFHTSRWDYQYTGGSPVNPTLTCLQEKKVGIIGTGATAIQCIPELAKWAKELYVFQRTPSSVDYRGNKETDPEWFEREVKAGGKGWQQRRSDNFDAHISNAATGNDMVADEWTRMHTFCTIVGTPGRITDLPAYIKRLHALDFPRQQKIRKRVDDIVKDKDTADTLKPWYAGWCKRPCFHDEYLPTFNRPNVHLVDVSNGGIQRIGKKGPVITGREYELDALIFSTGFFTSAGESPAARAASKVYGRRGVSLDDRWAAEGVSTLHGIMTRDFPNFFFTGPSQTGASANLVSVLDSLSTHIVYILSRGFSNYPSGRVIVEPTAEAMEAWASEVAARAGAGAGLSGCTPGYLNLEGAVDKPLTPEQRLKAARGALWGEGPADFYSRLVQWRAEGTLSGLEVRSAA